MEGLLELLKGSIVNTPSKGRDDDVPAMLSEGEYVIPADIVALLGDGNNQAGAGVLSSLLEFLKGLEVPEGTSIMDLLSKAKEGK
jgi:hypothetical protein